MKTFWRTTKTEKDVFDLIKNHDTFYVYDTETTGLSPIEDRIIEIAIRKIEKENEILKEVAKWDFYINPGFLISDKIESLTGITNEFLVDKPFEKEIFKEIKKILPNNSVLIGHNVNFDNKFLMELYKRNNSSIDIKSIDTLEMARDLFEKGKDVENHKLCTIASYFELDTQFHLAINDTYVTFEVFKRMLEEYQKRESLSTEIKQQPKIKTTVLSCNRWEKRFGKTFMSRIYITTENGDCYFDCLGQQWHDKDKNGDFLERIDMDKLEKDVLSMTKCSDLSELRNWKKDAS